MTNGNRGGVMSEKKKVTGPKRFLSYADLGLKPPSEKKKQEHVENCPQALSLPLRQHRGVLGPEDFAPMAPIPEDPNQAEAGLGSLLVPGWARPNKSVAPPREVPRGRIFGDELTEAFMPTVGKAEFDESKHPRGEGGKWAPKGTAKPSGPRPSSGSPSGGGGEKWAKERVIGDTVDTILSSVAQAESHHEEREPISRGDLQGNMEAMVSIALRSGAAKAGKKVDLGGGAGFDALFNYSDKLLDVHDNLTPGKVDRDKVAREVGSILSQAYAEGERLAGASKGSAAMPFSEAATRGAWSPEQPETTATVPAGEADAQQKAMEEIEGYAEDVEDLLGRADSDMNEAQRLYDERTDAENRREKAWLEQRMHRSFSSGVAQIAEASEMVIGAIDTAGDANLIPEDKKARAKEIRDQVQEVFDDPESIADPNDGIDAMNKVRAAMKEFKEIISDKPRAPIEKPKSVSWRDGQLKAYDGFIGLTDKAQRMLHMSWRKEDGKKRAEVYRGMLKYLRDNKKFVADEDSRHFDSVIGDLEEIQRKASSGQSYGFDEEGILWGTRHKIRSLFHPPAPGGRWTGD